MRGHIRKHGNGWAVVIDLGRHVACQVCEQCGHRFYPKNGSSPTAWRLIPDGRGAR